MLCSTVKEDIFINGMIFSRALLKAQAIGMLNSCVTNNKTVKQETYKTEFKNN